MATSSASTKKASKKRRKKSSKRKTKPPVSERSRVSQASLAACVVGSSSKGKKSRRGQKKVCGPNAPSFAQAADKFSRMGVQARRGNPEEERIMELRMNPERQRQLANRLSNP